MRSFDQRSHSYLGYVLRIQGTIGDEEREFPVGIGQAAQAKYKFQASDILLMPSRSEGLPVVGVQALAAGLAIVASDVGGFSEIVQQGINGYLFEPEDEFGMAQAIAGYLDDPSLLKEAKCASRERAARFDLKEIGEAYQDLFAQVIAE